MQATQNARAFSKARPYHLTDENNVRVQTVFLTAQQAHNANRDLFDQWLAQVGTGYHHLWRWKPCYVHPECHHCF